MDENNILTLKDGDPTLLQGFEAPSKAELTKPKIEGINRKKRRRGKFKRKLVKPFVKVPWQDKRRNNDKIKRNNRFRKIVLAKTQAPFNNNQFLMEIHKPEPENSFDILRTPARTRDSSFSVDSEDNYFYSLPEDEEEYLTKEFSSVYEDAQSERLSNMSKNELIQEYLLLEAKYDNLVKRTERLKQKPIDVDNEGTDREKSDVDSMVTDKDTSGTSIESSAVDEPTYSDLLQQLKEQEEHVSELQRTNEKLRLENEHLTHKRPQGASQESEDSESDSSSSSDSDSSSNTSVVDAQVEVCDTEGINDVHVNGQNGETTEPAMVNGFHSANEETC